MPLPLHICIYARLEGHLRRLQIAMSPKDLLAAIASSYPHLCSPQKGDFQWLQIATSLLPSPLHIRIYARLKGHLGLYILPLPLHLHVYACIKGHLGQCIFSFLGIF